MSDLRGLDRVVADACELIEKHGHMVTGVFGEDVAENFCYTVGRTEADKPELWLGQLPPQLAQQILNRLALGLDVTAPREVTAEEAEFSCGFRVVGPVDAQRFPLGMAARLYGREADAYSVLQVLWPDDEGRFPGEDGYDAERFPQTVLPLAAS